MSSKPLFSFRTRPEVADAIKAAAASDRRPTAQFLSNLVEDALSSKQTSVPEQRSAA